MTCSTEDWDSIKAEQLPVPSSFLCPIYQEIMVDPVSTVDGHTYERQSINVWFQRGCISSPLTGLPLPSCALLPNTALKGAIAEYLSRRPQLCRQISEQRDYELAVATWASEVEGKQQCVVELKTALQKTKSERDMAQEQLEKTKKELNMARAQLDKTKNELDKTQEQRERLDWDLRLAQQKMQQKTRRMQELAQACEKAAALAVAARDQDMPPHITSTELPVTIVTPALPYPPIVALPLSCPTEYPLPTIECPAPSSPTEYPVSTAECPAPSSPTEYREPTAVPTECLSRSRSRSRGRIAAMNANI